MYSAVNSIHVRTIANYSRSASDNQSLQLPLFQEHRMYAESNVAILLGIGFYLPKIFCRILSNVDNHKVGRVKFQVKVPKSSYPASYTGQFRILYSSEI